MTSLQTTQALDGGQLPVPSDGGPAPEHESLQINLWVRDPEVVATLSARPQGRSRDDLVRSSLKIGILAIRQAQGRIDAEAIRKEGERLIEALDEIRTARDNREAEVSLFIFSQKTAPAGLMPLARYGADVVVVWDAEDEATDVILSSALLVCKALSVRARSRKNELAADIDGLEKAIREVERQAGLLNEIKTSASTIKSGAERILNRAESMRLALEKQIEVLDNQTALLKGLMVRTGAV